MDWKRDRIQHANRKIHGRWWFVNMVRICTKSRSYEKLRIPEYWGHWWEPTKCPVCSCRWRNIEHLHGSPWWSYCWLGFHILQYVGPLFLNWTSIFDWNMTWLVFKHEHCNDTCCDEIGLCVQKIGIIVGLTNLWTKRTYLVTQRERESSLWSLLISILIFQLRNDKSSDSLKACPH